MIAYEVLVQTIADWKAGARPSAPTPAVASAGAPEAVEELSSGVVDFDEADAYAASDDEIEAEIDADTDLSDDDAAVSGAGHDAGEHGDYGYGSGASYEQAQGAESGAGYEQQAYGSGVSYEQPASDPYVDDDDDAQR